jgi:hypothetical protein
MNIDVSELGSVVVAVVVGREFFKGIRKGRFCWRCRCKACKKRDKRGCGKGG